jgi:hypothetical protein
VSTEQRVLMLETAAPTKLADMCACVAGAAVNCCPGEALSFKFCLRLLGPFHAMSVFAFMNGRGVI